MENAMHKLLALIWVLIFAIVAPSRADEIWQTLPAFPPMPKADTSGRVDVNDISMYYAVYGGGDPARETVILLHGGLSHSDIWGYQIPALTAAGYRVIAADSRGHGRSTRSARPFGYALMAADVAALMDSLKIRKAAIIGWSDGGIIGLDLAMNHADKVSKVFAFGANTSVTGSRDDIAGNETFNRYMNNMATDYERLSPTPTEYEAFVAQITKMWATQPNYTADQLATIQVPVMIADGDHDEAIRQEHNREMVGLIPGARLNIFQGASHFAFLQRPEQFNAAMLEFLRE
jgi:pimeloyl-ACP methyl ester carboxylesterase